MVIKSNERNIKKAIIKHIRSGIGISETFTIITIAIIYIIYRMYGLGVIALIDYVSWIIALLGLLSAALTMILIEFTFIYLKIHPLKKKWKRRPKVFEFGFFFSLFLATLFSTLMASEYFSKGMSVQVLENWMWFSAFYGISFTFGMYHYLWGYDEPDGPWFEKRTIKNQGERNHTQQNMLEKLKFLLIKIWRMKKSMSLRLDVKEEDMNVLDDALKQIAKHKEHSGMPDFSHTWVAYVLPLTLALLKSDKTLHRLTWLLAFLTVILVIENVVLILFLK